MAIRNDIRDGIVKALIPVAVATGTACFRRIRAATKIRKSFLCVPPKSGKTIVSNMLMRSQRDVLVVDLDSEIPSYCKSTLVDRLEGAKMTQNYKALDVAYSECASIVLDRYRRILSSDRKLRILFVSSNYTWVSSVAKPDSIFVACPSEDILLKQIIAREDEATYDHFKGHTDGQARAAETVLINRERIQASRKVFIDSLPAAVKSSASIYNSFDELYGLIRDRFHLHRAL